MRTSGVRFSIARHAAWAPQLLTSGAWRDWAAAPFDTGSGAQPALDQMSAMLRRRAGALGKLCLHVAYECLDGASGVPTVFCSRHGDVARAVELLGDLAQEQPLSPTAFGMSVHNANAGLFSIARGDRSNHIALSAGHDTIEHGVIEACGLLADGAPAVLLVAGDVPLPEPLAQFEDCPERAHAWAWLMVPGAAFSLNWQACEAVQGDAHEAARMPAGLDILRFYFGAPRRFERTSGRRRWTWERHA